jgi:hypothetical protein
VSSASGFVYPSRKTEQIVKLPLMRAIIRRTLEAHADPGLVMWAGPSRNGKTTTAKFMVSQMNIDAEAQVEGAFRGRHMEVGSGPRTASQKWGIKHLYWEFAGKVAERIFQRETPRSLALHVVDALRKWRIQMVFVDEAGYLSTEELQGMVLVLDVAREEDWPLTIVLIGMNDLPIKVNNCPQINGRVVSWSFFEAYGLEDTLDFLANLNSEFAKLSLRVPAHREIVEFIKGEFGGILGEMVKFLRHLNHRRNADPGDPFDLLLMRAVALSMKCERDRSLNASRSGKWVTPDPAAQSARLAGSPPARGSSKLAGSPPARGSNKPAGSPSTRGPAPESKGKHASG